MNDTSPRHYVKECGCMFSEGVSKQWYTCPQHHSATQQVPIKQAEYVQNLDVDKLSQESNSGIKFHQFSSRASYIIDNIAIPTIKLQLTPASTGLTVRRFWLYALRLEGNKFYVGITARKNPYSRIRQHGNLFGAKWTGKFKPVEVLEIRDLGVMDLRSAEMIEQRVTKAYMKVYGYRKVRGGNITYSGHIFKVGPFILSGWWLSELFTALLLLALAYYILARDIL